MLLVFENIILDDIEEVGIFKYSLVRWERMG